MAKVERNDGRSQTASLLSSARALIALQLVSRLVTFALNQALVRLASARVFGTASIQFDLLRDTILFLSREAVRGVVSRIPRQLDAQTNLPSQHIRNLFYLPGLLSLPVTVAAVGIYHANLSLTTSSQDGFSTALVLYILSTLIETLLVEPIFLYSLIEADEPNVAIRVRAEGTAVIVKAVVTTSLLAYFTHTGRPSQALLCFGVGQLSYALTLLVRFAAHYTADSHQRRTFAPTALIGGQATETRTSSSLSHYDAGHLRLVCAITAQSLFKHFLTEGDRLVVAWTSPLDDQGGYAVASNYASLVARIVFQPIEESSRLYFSRTLGSGKIIDDAQPFRILTNLVRSSLFLLATCPAFVPPFAPIVLPYSLPRHYLATSAQQTLTAYLTLYLPILSLNGILESFFAATSGVRGLGGQSAFLVACSGAFAASLWGLDQLQSHSITPSRLVPWLTPETSLVYANCIQMLLRIVFAARHAKRLYGRRTFKERVASISPSWTSLLAVGVAGFLLRQVVAKIRWQDDLLRRLATVGLGGFCGLACVALFALHERKAWAIALKPTKTHAKVE